MADESEREFDDPLAELEAMQAVAKALKGFSRNSAARVLRWAAEHFSMDQAPGGPQALPLPTTTEAGSLGNQATLDAQTLPGQFRDAADLISHTGVTTGPDRALLAAYWVQAVDGRDGFDGYTINNMLKNMGYRLSNVTTTLASLMHQKPALVLQVKKSGQTKQARKLYRVTREGENRAERIIRREDL
ncbi:MAG: hypothetical protein ACREPY_07290 [Rhodanobacteraceae bacterium]